MASSLDTDNIFLGLKSRKRLFLPSFLMISQSVSPLHATQDLDFSERVQRRFTLSSELNVSLKEIKLGSTVIKEFSTGEGQSILLAYSKGQRKVFGYIIDKEEQSTPIKQHDMPKELGQIASAELFEAFCRNAYVRPRLLSNGDISFSIQQRGLGGGRLHDAIERKCTERLEILLKSDTKKEIDEYDEEGLTPLQRAAKLGNLKAVQVLLKHGARVTKVDDKNGRTALHWAALHDKDKVYQFLLKQKGDDPTWTTRQDKHKQTAADLILEQARKRFSSSSSSSSSSASVNSLTISPATVDEAFRLKLEKYLQLEKLDLKGCVKLTDASIKSNVKKLTSLQEINLTDCVQVTDLTVRFLAERLKSSLRKVDLTGIPGIPRETFLNLQQTGIILRPSGGAEDTLDCSNKVIDDDELAEELRSYPNIQTLNLSGCGFITDAGLKNLLVLKGLTMLDIRGCKGIPATAIKSFVGQFPLKGLLTDTLPTLKPEIINVQEKSLESSSALNLSGQPEISDEENNSEQQPEVVVLDLSNQKNITDAELSIVLQKSPPLHTLNIRDCNKLTDKILAHLEKFPSLTSLNLSTGWQNTTQFTDAGIVHVAKLSALTSLDLCNCNNLTNACLIHLAKIPSLTSLNIGKHCVSLWSGANFTDAGMVHILKLSGLTSLGLPQWDKLTDEGLVHLSKLSNLTSLNIGWSEKITDGGLVHVAKLSGLTSLDLSYSMTIFGGAPVHGCWYDACGKAAQSAFVESVWMHQAY